MPDGLRALSEKLRLPLEHACLSALEHHVGQFSEFGRPVAARQAAELLAEGRFAARPFEGCNLWHDIALAVCLAAREEEAVGLFHQRFDHEIQIWVGRYAGKDAEAAQDFLGDLILPREKSGPRIESYKGHAPLVAWLKQVFRSQADRRRKAMRLPVVSLSGTRDDDREHMNVADGRQADPQDDYAARDCRQHMQPILSQVFGILSPEEHAVVMMSVVDEVPQVKIAQLLGVRDYKVTRIKQTAFERLQARFLELARTASRLTEMAVRECVALIISKFGFTESLN